MDQVKRRARNVEQNEMLISRKICPCFDFPFDKLRIRSARTGLTSRLFFPPFALSVTAVGGEVEGYPSA
jgi:hypothetical protein